MRVTQIAGERFEALEMSYFEVIHAQRTSGGGKWKFEGRAAGTIKNAPRLKERGASNYKRFRSGSAQHLAQGSEKPCHILLL